MGAGTTWSMTIVGAPAVLHDNTITGPGDTEVVMIVTDSGTVLGL